MDFSFLDIAFKIIAWGAVALFIAAILVAFFIGRAMAPGSVANDPANAPAPAPTSPTITIVVVLSDPPYSIFNTVSPGHYWLRSLCNVEDGNLAWTEWHIVEAWDSEPNNPRSKRTFSREFAPPTLNVPKVVHELYRIEPPAECRSHVH